MNPTFCALAVFVAIGADPELTHDQKLIVACYRLNVEEVVDCLRAGADVNAVFGDENESVLGGDEGPGVFADRWRGGWPIARARWTPLMAVASSSEFPDPPPEFEPTDNWQQRHAVQQGIPIAQVNERRRRAVTILNILLSHNCDLDADDGFGATALYMAIDSDNRDNTALVKLLLDYGANPNTKTRAYIDGPSNNTPLHRAARSRELAQLLLDHGADPRARDTWGETPADENARDPNRDFDLVVTPTGATIRPRTRRGGK